MVSVAAAIVMSDHHYYRLYPYQYFAYLSS